MLICFMLFMFYIYFCIVYVCGLCFMLICFYFNVQLASLCCMIIWLHVQYMEYNNTLDSKFYWFSDCCVLDMRLSYYMTAACEWNINRVLMKFSLRRFHENILYLLLLLCKFLTYKTVLLLKSQNLIYLVYYLDSQENQHSYYYKLGLNIIYLLHVYTYITNFITLKI